MTTDQSFDRTPEALYYERTHAAPGQAWWRVDSFLYVMQSESTEHLIDQNSLETVSVGRQETLTAIPCAVLSFGSDDDGEMEKHLADANANAQAVGWRLPDCSNERGLPLHVNISDRARYSLDEANNLRIIAPGALEGQDLKLEPRLAWFLRCTGTLSLRIETKRRIFCGTVKAVGDQDDGIFVAMHNPGSLSSPHAHQIIDRSTKWLSIIPANRDILLGGAEFAGDHYFTYGMLQNEGLPLSKPVSRVDCLLCRRTGEMSVEHCTPSWLVENLALHPVTARILCSECNGRLGQELEVPMRDWYLEKVQPANLHKLATLWTYKTALMLAAAGGVPVARDLTDALCTNDIAAGVHVYFLHQANLESVGYSFTVTRFRQSMLERRCFLLTFGIGRLAGIVLRSPVPMPEQLPLFEQLHPSLEPGLDSENFDIPDLHEALLSHITGDSYVHEMAPTRQITPRASRRRRSNRGV